jgi:large subunit ribosomal protein L22
MSTTGTVARLRYVRTSPSKVRQVLRLIQGQDIETARATLALCEKGIAEDLAKLLDSAVANAEHNDAIPADDLFVARAYADEGPTGKRWRPRARGRGTRIRKRTSHITIVVARFDEDELDRRREKAAASPARGWATRRPRRPRRERAVETHDHDHDHDEEPEIVDAPDPVQEAGTEAPAAEAETVDDEPEERS